MSGHIFFADEYYGFDDALFAAARLLRSIVLSGRSLAQLRDELPAFATTPEIRIDCPDDRKFEIIAELRDQLAAENIKFNDIDGVRTRTAGGLWLLRASNTQAALVARGTKRSGAEEYHRGPAGKANYFPAQKLSDLALWRESRGTRKTARSDGYELGLPRPWSDLRRKSV